ncbi:MAG TPA: hypothetical protein VNK04_02510 [Gemmataceae bacterium]|nr:hypothetical protein [Gemmataceae bacterium]
MHRIVTALSLLLAVGAVVAVAEVRAADKDTAKAAATRKKLKQKVTVNWKDTRLADIVEDIKEMVPGVSVRLDNKGGVSNNRKVTYAAKDKPLEEVLNELCAKEGLGWYVISKEKDAYDGTIWLKIGKERGYPEGQEPGKK